MTSAACEFIARSPMSVATASAIWIIGRDAPPGRPTFSILACTGKEFDGHLGEMSLPHGEPAGAGEIAGAGDPKLNCTGGGRSAPGCAVKNGRGANPNIPAIRFVGTLR